MTVIEIRIEKVENGYIVEEINFHGKKRVFRDFSGLLEYLQQEFVVTEVKS